MVRGELESSKLYVMASLSCHGMGCSTMLSSKQKDSMRAQIIG